MAKELRGLEQEFIANVREKTGRDIPEWMTVIGATGLDKPNAILSWLKTTHKLNHMQANFLAGMYLNGGQPVYDYEVMFTKLFEGKAHLRPVYEELQGTIAQQMPQVEFIPTKTYVSIEAKRCFACATLTKNSIRVGLDLGDTPMDEYVQKAKSLGAMPNLTHMIEIAEPSQVDECLLGYVGRAYAHAHKL